MLKEAPAGTWTGTNPRAGPLILLVDDNTAFIETLADRFEARGYRVITARDAIHAREAVRGHTVEVAVLDLTLPDTNGLELLSTIRARSPTTEVIILTGHGSVATAVKAMSRGAFSYVEKPCPFERLYVLVVRALARRSAKMEAAGPNDTLPWLAYEPASGHVTTSGPALGRLLADHLDRFSRLLPDPAERSRHLSALRLTGHAVSDVMRPDGRRLRVCSYGDESGARAIVLDVTAEHRHHAESDRLRRHFETLFENLPAGVAIINSDYVVTRANQAFARCYDLSPVEAIGRRCHDIIHGRATPCHSHGEVCPIKNSLATGATVRVLHRHRHADGVIRDIEATVAPLCDDSGTVVSFITILADFTAVKRTQAESEEKSRRLEELNRRLREQQEHQGRLAAELTRRNRELVQANTAKDEFLSTVSHELRTPLTAICESINLVADGTLGAVAERQARFLGLALGNTRRLGDTINNLLDASRLKAGRVECRPAPLDLAELTANVAAGFGAAARNKGIGIACHRAAESVPVFADPCQVRRAICNLVGNAVKFTDRGSVTLACRLRKDEALISVTDTGVGIPAEEQVKIFERFSQGREGRARPHGTGLGLPLARRLIELNGGRLWFESTEGTGSSFHLALPLDSPASRLAWLLGQRPPAPGRSWLLLIRADPGTGLSARLDDACRLAAEPRRTQDTPVTAVPGCHLTGSVSPVATQAVPLSPTLALLLTGNEEAACAACRRVREGIGGDDSTRPGLRLVPLSAGTDVADLLAALKEAPNA